MMATLYTFHRQSSDLKRHNVARAYVDLREREREIWKEQTLKFRTKVIARIKSIKLLIPLSGIIFTTFVFSLLFFSMITFAYSTKCNILPSAAFKWKLILKW